MGSPSPSLSSSKQQQGCDKNSVRRNAVACILNPRGVQTDEERVESEYTGFAGNLDRMQFDSRMRDRIERW